MNTDEKLELALQGLRQIAESDLPTLELRGMARFYLEEDRGAGTNTKAQLDALRKAVLDYAAVYTRSGRNVQWQRAGRMFNLAAGSYEDTTERGRDLREDKMWERSARDQERS